MFRSSSNATKFQPDLLRFETQEQRAGVTKLSAFYQTKEIAHALYATAPQGGLLLNWIETNEQFQNNGVASLLLNKICGLAKDNKTYLEINVVDEQVLNDFYFKWFQRTYNPTHIAPDKITAIFNDIVFAGDSHPSIRLSVADLEILTDSTSKNVIKLGRHSS